MITVLYTALDQEVHFTVVSFFDSASQLLNNDMKTY